MPRDRPTPADPPDPPDPPDQPAQPAHDPAIPFPDGPHSRRDLELRPDAPSAWNTPGIADHPDRPRPDTIRLPPDRLAHILDGDEHGQGGHLHGTGFPGKSEFPADWDEDRIAAAVLHTAYRPQHVQQRENGRWVVHRIHDQVGVSAVVRPDGRIWTAFPDPGSPGVTRNPSTRNH